MTNQNKIKKCDQIQNKNPRDASLDECAHTLNTLHRLLQPLESVPLLDIATLQHGDPFLQAGARLALLGHHLVGLAEQLGRQLLQLGGGLGELRFGGAAQVLFATEGVLQLDRVFVGGLWRW